MERIRHISRTNRAIAEEAKMNWDSIAKPLGSFGILEDMIIKIASIQETQHPDISKRIAVVMCGDHGVVAEGVTQCGSEVTGECADAIADGRSNINAVAKRYGIDVIAVDVGISGEVRSERVIDKKIAYGTKNIVCGPAMTLEQAIKAVITGIDIAGELKSKGYKLIITGEMGIGNTTPASAIASVLLEKDVREVTGRGAGLTSEGLERKVSAIEKAIKINRPEKNEPLELLSKIGGYEIAAMTGLFLGGAYYHVPVIIDGVISAASAAIAYKIEPVSAEYMLASHCSEEPASLGFLKMIGARPVIDAGLRLGEGTGGALLTALLDGAIALYNNSHKFEDTGIERYVPLK